MRRYGEEGRRLARLARGIDRAHGQRRPRNQERLVGDHVRERHRRFPHARAHPLDRDRGSLGAAEEKALAGATVTLKLKTADFKIRTRATLRDADPARDQNFCRGARTCWRRETDGTRFRLLGVGVSALTTADQADPADLVDGRAIEAEHAVDRLRARFGDQAVVGGLGVREAEGKLDGSYETISKNRPAGSRTGLCFPHFQRSKFAA